MTKRSQETAQIDLGPHDVSVVIPTRNRAPLLTTALGSALAQEGVSLEVIVVDDGSDDDMTEVVAAAGDRRARCVRLQHRSRQARARNRGIAEASGEWLAFLDDDDRWEPAKLRCQLDALRATGASWAWTSARVVEAGQPSYVKAAPAPDAIRMLLRKANAVPGSSSGVVAKTELVRRLGGFDEDLDHLVDWDLWIRLADEAPGAACDEVLVHQVLHAGGIHARETDALLDEMDRLRAKHPDLDSVEFVRWVARAHRRAGRRWSARRDYVRGRWRLHRAPRA